MSVDIDESTNATYKMSSDRYFAEYPARYDIIFIDGLHEHNQVYRDIIHSLHHLNHDGVIVLHDCCPESEYMQRHCTESQQGTIWTGDVWKAFVKARADLPYEMYVVNVDYGCGIIDTALPKVSDTSALPQNMESMQYSEFLSCANDWMNFKPDIIRTNQNP